jgi:hypothetical protein
VHVRGRGVGQDRVGACLQAVRAARGAAPAEV